MVREVLVVFGDNKPSQYRKNIVRGSSSSRDISVSQRHKLRPSREGHKEGDEAEE